MKHCALPLLALAVLTAAPALAQADSTDVSPVVTTTPLRLSGPRFGATLATGETARRLDEDYDASPVFTQFGWQFETRIFHIEDTGLTGVTEWVPLVGGLEQGLFLPSLTFLVGLRTAGGTEVGIGPNVSATGAAYAVAAGVTRSYGRLNVPVNVSAVFSDDGVRFSLLLGFTVSQ